MARIRITVGITFSICVLLGYSFAQDQVETNRTGSDRSPSSAQAAADAPQPPAVVGHPTFVSPHASPIAISGGNVFVVNTPAATVDVIDPKTRKITARVNVGIDPVGIAVRPDGKEVWVSNHVSDSVSVIDNDAKSPTYLHVIATIQEFDPQTKATRFDEPVGIAFASNAKAYVALSSENQIAVVNVAARTIDKRLTINAQDPRAIAVRNGRLFVIPFESNNQTQLSGGAKEKVDGELVTFDAWNHSIANNNVLSLGHVVDIVKHPKVPDRDLYVFDTNTDKLVAVVDTLGTLLYGLTVDSKGRVFVAQTDARNEANGRSGTKKHGLAELENRAFLNRITTVSFGGPAATEPNSQASGATEKTSGATEKTSGATEKTSGVAKPAASAGGSQGGTQASVKFIDLEPLPPKQPAKSLALATPFAIEVSADDSTLVVSAAGSDTLFTVDAASGEVLGRVNVGAAPRGIALENVDGGKAPHAWVLNALANSVSLVDLSDAASPKLLETIPLEDPTHPAVKRGNIAFNTASASSTGTFSCASCHPDGHTDQLLWVLKTPIVSGGNQIMPRSTMPIRGLRDTAPFHWDGIPGDPYGGNNSANIHGSDKPNSSVDNPDSSTRNLIDGGIASTMSLAGDTTINDEGKAGALSAAERDDMAKFLLSVPFPPAQRRAYNNVVSSEATKGFKLFHIDGDLDPGKQRPNVCGSCHRMPFLVSTNTPGTGMDAPTWRGAYDRFLILPQGRLNIIDFDFYARVAEAGIPERSVWQFSWGGRRRFDPVWNMVLEGSTGFSGSFARQVTLDKSSVKDELTKDVLDALELSACEGAIVLEAEGVLLSESTSKTVALQFDARFHGGTYVSREPTALDAGRRNPATSESTIPPTPDARAFGSRASEFFTRAKLIELASTGKFVGTFTGRHGVKANVEHPQPAIWTLGPIERQSGRQEFPTLHDGNHLMTISGRHVDVDAHLIVDGRRVSGGVRVESGEKLEIELPTLPPVGMHLLQVQNSNGLFSNDFIFHVTENAEAATELKRRTDQEHADTRDALAGAISRGDLDETKRFLDRGARVNDRRPRGGSTPLSTAALHGNLDIVKLLIQRGAKVDVTNEDGNTPLHVAAFLCRTDVVQFLLEKGGSALTKNKRGETPIDVVSAPWSTPLAGFYKGIGKGSGFEVDLAGIERDRPQTAKLLQDHATKSDQKAENKNSDK